MQSNSKFCAIAIAFVMNAGAAIPANAQNPMTRASADAAGNQANGYCFPPMFSGDGRFVTFSSYSNNLVANDTNNRVDVFVKNLATGAIERMNVDSAGNQANAESYVSAISFDGRYVAFQSPASNLVAGDTNGWEDVFLRDRDPDGNGVFDEGNGTTTRVSVDSSGAQGDNGSGLSSLGISGDGRFVVFASGATNLVAGDGNGLEDVFMHDCVTGVTTRISVSSSGVEADDSCIGPSISADGRLVAFTSFAKTLAAGDTNRHGDVFLRDVAAGTTTRIDVRSDGGQATGGDAYFPSLSSDGRFVAFESSATNLVDGDTNGKFDVFVRDTATGTTTRVSVDSSGAEASEYSIGAELSSDGRIVVFSSAAPNLAPDDTNGADDVFLHDCATGTTERISSTPLGTSGDGDSAYSAISSDGTLVAFNSAATDIVGGDTNQTVDVLVFDRTIGWAYGTWSSYGSGYPGTLGTPGFTSSDDPVFGGTFTIAADNSRGAWTPGFLLIGFDRASIPTSAGGTLLVDAVQYALLAIAPSGWTTSFTVPFDASLAGIVVDLQALELDPGASHGISFTPGLELKFGL